MGRVGSDEGGLAQIFATPPRRLMMFWGQVGEYAESSNVKVWATKAVLGTTQTVVAQELSWGAWHRDSS